MGSVADVDPYPVYEDYRASAPLVWDDSMGGWIVTSYRLCRFIEENERQFRHPYADANETLIEIKGGKRNPTIVQGREHFAMHRFLLRMFTPKIVEGYRSEHIKPVGEMLLGRFLSTGRAELVADLTTQFSPRVLMSLFGMDWRDDQLADRVLTLHETIMDWVGQQNRGDETTPRARAAAEELNAILIPHLLERKRAPRSDLISRIWTEAPAALDDFKDDDALAIGRELFLAGTDTTVHALANALNLLLTQPQVMARVRAERGATLAAFVEEALRLYGSVQYRFRLANADCELDGHEVKKDQVLILINAAANRDPAHYRCPANVDLDRPEPFDHLAFNAGPRTCVGAALARAEMIDMVELLLDCTRNLRLDPDASLPSFRFHYTRSFRPLHVLFDPI
jgi:cytochrome P450